MLAFLREKFEFLVVTLVLIILIQAWIASGYRPDLKEFVIIVSGAWLALLRVVQKPGTTINTDSVNADSIASATTETGDIVSKTPPATSTIK